jgi:hypothetical protein
MNLTALALPRVPFGPGRPAPSGAVITPTRSADPMSVLTRALDRLIDAWKARPARHPTADDDMPVDAATLRDLGVSHAALLRR